ncbi:class I SAM-dependent methyltransferase family protein [Candidatus Woesearchaeota archaeon]|nr:class I SAM-dependent methyltransferase family protein [Candidatus Woesearchaeota archaeon]
MKPPSLKDALKGYLTDEELPHIVRSYDIVGDIAIIDIPEGLAAKERLIGETILTIHKNVNVVCKRASHYDGEFRTQELAVIAGEDRKETLYKENGCQFFLNPETCYFSARSGNERKRITGLVQPGERVLVMFAGIGPFAIVVAKHHKDVAVVAVEKNPAAAEYGKRNVVKNKLANCTFIEGDVREVVPGLEGEFDRIIMPLPKSAEDFLDVALAKLKQGGMLHFYDFQREDEFSIAEDKVKKACATACRDCTSLESVACGQYAPYVHRVCVDAKIL